MVDVSTTHEKRDDEQVSTKTVELDNGDVVEFEGPPGGPYEYAGDEAPPREAVRALQEATDEDVELAVDDQEDSDDGGEA
jgi:hypothetical protein